MQQFPGALSTVNILLPFAVESGLVSVELRHRRAPPRAYNYGAYNYERAAKATLKAGHALLVCEALLHPLKDFDVA